MENNSELCSVFKQHSKGALGGQPKDLAFSLSYFSLIFSQSSTVFSPVPSHFFYFCLMLDVLSRNRCRVVRATMHLMKRRVEVRLCFIEHYTNRLCFYELTSNRILNFFWGGGVIAFLHFSSACTSFSHAKSINFQNQIFWMH